METPHARQGRVAYEPTGESIIAGALNRTLPNFPDGCDDGFHQEIHYAVKPTHEQHLAGCSKLIHLTARRGNKHDR